MTEAEWLASDDPARMLAWITGNWWYGQDRANSIISRKLRLFAVACAEATETQSPGVAPGAGGWAQWAELTDDNRGSTMTAADGAMYWAGGKVGQHHVHQLTQQGKAHAAALLRDIVGNPFRPVTATEEAEQTRWPDDELRISTLSRGKATFLVPARWLTPTVLALAQGIYAERAFDRMPILADALMDAGCTNDDVIRHCCGWQRCHRCAAQGCPCDVCAIGGDSAVGWFPSEPDSYRHPHGPHVRGCWVIELLVGKE